MATSNMKAKMMVSKYDNHMTTLGNDYEQDPYGDEIEGGEQDKNDGLNALVSIILVLTPYIESLMGYWLQ